MLPQVCAFSGINCPAVGDRTSRVANTLRKRLLGSLREPVVTCGASDLHWGLAQAVVCRGLTKEFGAGAARVQALRGVDFTAEAGEMTFLVGPSGCGKTTLISVIAGILQPSGGDVNVLGTDLGSLSARQLVEFRRRNIGFVFQQYNLLPALTAAENVAVPLLIAGQSRRAAIVQATAMLDAVGLGDRASALPSQLSGGQQQRVAIARALIHQPRLVVCDEPTAALDARNGRQAMELLSGTALGADRAVIVVTHDNRVFDFADKIVSMNDGRIEEERVSGE